MGMMEAVTAVLGGAFDFSGRASRREYWYFQFFNFLLFFGMMFLSMFLGELGLVLMLLMLVWMVIIIIPSLAVLVRRLHDAGRSGWWLLLGFIPFGSLVLLVFTCLDSEPAINEWGEIPYGSGQWQG